MSTQQDLLNAKNKAYSETSKLYKKANDDYIKSLINTYNTQVKDAKSKAQKSKDSLTAKYQNEYDLNLINQLVNERKLKEKMDKLGLTNSGFNASNLTSLAVSRINSDNQTTAKKSAESNAINQNLNNTLAQLLKTKNEKTAESQKALTEKNAALIKNLNEKYQSDLASIKKEKIKAANSSKSKSTSSSSINTGKNLLNVYGKLYSITGPTNRIGFLNTVTAAGYITPKQRDSLMKSMGLKR